MTEINTLFVGRNFLQFPSLPSTNAYALDLLSKNVVAEGTVISTFQQEEGRGQVGNKWESEPHKNISISVILKPHFLEARQQFELNIAVSLAVFDVISQYVEGAKVKWSNDIYIKRKKVAGILIQNTLAGKRIQHTVIGIGINVNQIVFKSDAPNPTSLQLETRTIFDLQDLIAQLCVKIEQRYLQLKSKKELILRQEYLKNLYLKDVPATFQRKNASYFTGIIRNISEIGELIIETETHKEAFGFKEIRFCV